jgi:hypothetical protein
MTPRPRLKRNDKLDQLRFGARGGDVHQVTLLNLLPFLASIEARAGVGAVEPIDAVPFTAFRLVNGRQAQDTANLVGKRLVDLVDNGRDAGLSGFAATIDNHL